MAAANVKMSDSIGNQRHATSRSSPIQLGLLHRNRLFCDCMVSAFSALETFDAVAFDHRQAECLRSIQATRPDLLLVDSKLPARWALEVTHFVLNQVGRTKILLLGSADCEEILIDCIGAGAHGCVLEDSTLAELQHALEKVYHGEPYCSPFLVHSMLRSLAETPSPPRWLDGARTLRLTFREHEILQLISQHLGNKAIAKQLSISVYTVKNHLHNIFEKLQVGSRFEAVEYARKRNWISPLQPG